MFSFSSAIALGWGEVTNPNIWRLDVLGYAIANPTYELYSEVVMTQGIPTIDASLLGYAIANPTYELL